jgi:hypothetical protein
MSTLSRVEDSHRKWIISIAQAQKWLVGLAKRHNACMNYAPDLLVLCLQITVRIRCFLRCYSLLPAPYPTFGLGEVDRQSHIRLYRHHQE